MNRDCAGQNIIWPDDALFLHPDTDVSGDETYFDTTSFLGYFSIRGISNV